MTKIIGIGIDLTRISRFDRLLKQYKSQQLVSKMLSAVEVAEFKLLNEKARPRYLSVRWACKEALYKAGIRKRFPEITIEKVDKQPMVRLEEYDCLLSVSHDGDIVVANAVVTK